MPFAVPHVYWLDTDTRIQVPLPNVLVSTTYAARNALATSVLTLVTSTSALSLMLAPSWSSLALARFGSTLAFRSLKLV